MYKNRANKRHEALYFKIMSRFYRVDAAGGHAYWHPEDAKLIADTLDKILVNRNENWMIHSASMYVKKFRCTIHENDARVFLLMEARGLVTVEELRWFFNFNIPADATERARKEINSLWFSSLPENVMQLDMHDYADSLYKHYEPVAV